MTEEALQYKDVMENMHYNVREQRTHDRSRVTEVLPYFDFQNKIETKLLHIKQKNEMRLNIQESRIKICKNQARDGKAAMSHNLRDKVNELVEQEIENKSTKLKMVAGRRKGNDMEQMGVKQSTHERKHSSMSSANKHKKEVVVTASNFHIYKKISDQIDICEMLQKYFKMLQDDQIDTDFDQLKPHSDVKRLRDDLKSLCNELFKMKESEIQLLGIAIRAGEAGLQKRKARKGVGSSFGNLRGSYNKSLQSDSRNHHLSNNSTNKNSKGSHLENTDPDYQAMQLHNKLVQQIEMDQLEIDETIIIMKYEKILVRHNILVKDHDELNKIKLSKEKEIIKFIKEMNKLKQALGIPIYENQKTFESDTYYFEDTVDDSLHSQTKNKDQENTIIVDIYDLQVKEASFQYFKVELAKIKQHMERIKMCLNEHANAYAFKISLVKDVADIKMDDNIEIALKRYRAIWPFLPLDFIKDHKEFPNKLTSVFKKKYGGDSETSSKNLNVDLNLTRNTSAKRTGSLGGEDSDQLSTRKIKELLKEEEQKLKNRKSSFSVMLLQKNFQKALQQKIEIPLVFQQILDFARFLDRQLNVREGQPKSQNEMVGGGSKNDSLGALLAGIKQQKAAAATEPVVVAIVTEVSQGFDMGLSRAQNDLADVKQRDFQGKYIRFLAYNDQNLQLMMRKQRLDKQENQNGIQNTQEIVIEDKHIGESHVMEKLNQQLRLKGKPKSKNKRNSLPYQLRSGMNSASVNNQINHDKCMYSKLITFERQESAFVTKFLKKFEEAQYKLSQSTEYHSHHHSTTDIKENQPANLQEQLKDQMKKKHNTTNGSQLAHKPPLKSTTQKTTQNEQLKGILRNSKTHTTKAQSMLNSPKLNQSQTSKMMLQNITIDQINTRETLAHIKNLIRAQSASGERTTHFHSKFGTQTSITPKNNMSMSNAFQDKSKLRQSIASTSAHSHSIVNQLPLGKQSTIIRNSPTLFNRTTTNLNVLKL